MNLPLIFGITYGEHTTEYIPYVNITREKAWRFEYNPMLDIIQNHISNVAEEDFIGIVSWKFPMKAGINKDNLMKLFLSKHVNNQDTELYNLSPFLGDNIGNCGCFMDWSAKGHGEVLRTLIKECCSHTGMTYHNNPEHIVYANQFIARKDVYIDYMETIIRPSLELLENELWSTANTPANYTAGVAKNDLKKHTGLDFYNYIPFVLERMMMQFIVNWRIKTVNLI